MCKCFLCKEIGFKDEEMHKVKLDNEEIKLICSDCYSLGERIENEQYNNYLTEVFC